jgi:ATP-dependent Clp protease adapter protein ClpS
LRDRRQPVTSFRLAVPSFIAGCGDPPIPLRASDKICGWILRVPYSVLMATEVIEKPKLGNGAGLGFEARLIVLNDEVHTFDDVIGCFCRVLPAMTPAKANRLALEIHSSGQAEVWSGAREHAELYAEQIAATGLGVRVQ